MYCKNCGKEIKPEDFKCPHCGAETRRATASKKLKKISMITIGCILAVILIGVIVYKSGIIQNWQKQKEEISYAEKMLKKFEFNTLGIEANEAWAALYFSGEDVYMPSCRINNELRMGYVQKGQYYESYGKSEFEEVKDVTYSKKKFEDILGDIDIKEFVENKEGIKSYKGVSKAGKDVVKTYADLCLLKVKDLDFKGKGTIPCEIKIDGESTEVSFALSDDLNYTLFYYTGGTDGKSEIENTMYNWYSMEKLQAGTFYSVEKDEEIVLSDVKNALYIKDFKPYVKAEKNGVEYDVPYQDISVEYTSEESGVTEPVLVIGGEKYSATSRDEYVQKKQIEAEETARKNKIEKEKEEKLAYFKKIVPMGTEILIPDGNGSSKIYGRLTISSIKAEDSAYGETEYFYEGNYISTHTEELGLYSGENAMSTASCGNVIIDEDGNISIYVQEDTEKYGTYVLVLHFDKDGKMTLN